MADAFDQLIVGLEPMYDSIYNQSTIQLVQNRGSDILDGLTADMVRSFFPRFADPFQTASNAGVEGAIVVDIRLTRVEFEWTRTIQFLSRYLGNDTLAVAEMIYAGFYHAAFPTRIIPPLTSLFAKGNTSMDILKTCMLPEGKLFFRCTTGVRAEYISAWLRRYRNNRDVFVDLCGYLNSYKLANRHFTMAGFANLDYEQDVAETFNTLRAADYHTDLMYQQANDNITTHHYECPHCDNHIYWRRMTEHVLNQHRLLHSHNGMMCITCKQPVRPYVNKTDVNFVRHQAVCAMPSSKLYRGPNLLLSGGDYKAPRRFGFLNRLEPGDIQLFDLHKKSQPYYNFQNDLQEQTSILYILP